MQMGTEMKEKQKINRGAFPVQCRNYPEKSRCKLLCTVEVILDAGLTD